MGATVRAKVFPANCGGCVGFGQIGGILAARRYLWAFPTIIAAQLYGRDGALRRHALDAGRMRYRCAERRCLKFKPHVNELLKT